MLLKFSLCSNQCALLWSSIACGRIDYSTFDELLTHFWAVNHWWRSDECHLNRHCDFRLWNFITKSCLPSEVEKGVRSDYWLKCLAQGWRAPTIRLINFLAAAACQEIKTTSEYFQVIPEYQACRTTFCNQCRNLEYKHTDFHSMCSSDDIARDRDAINWRVS